MERNNLLQSNNELLRNNLKNHMHQKDILKRYLLDMKLTNQSARNDKYIESSNKLGTKRKLDIGKYLKIEDDFVSRILNANTTESITEKLSDKLKNAELPTEQYSEICMQNKDKLELVRLNFNQYKIQELIVKAVFKALDNSNTLQDSIVNILFNTIKSKFQKD